MLPPASYDHKSPNEQPVSLSFAPRVTLSSPNVVLQPPLTRRGIGPVLFLILPSEEILSLDSERTEKPLDPEPVQKWAEEGFVVVAITAPSNGLDAEQLEKWTEIGLEGASSCKQVDPQLSGIGIIIYAPEASKLAFDLILTNDRFVCISSYGTPPSSGGYADSRPLLLHLTAAPQSSSLNSALATVYKYSSTSPYFVHPNVTQYDPSLAAVSHSRTLVFLKKWIGGPTFDLEAIWDEHTYFEFEARSVAKTMGTMVAEPYVNHIPTMTGGIGRENLIAFYRDHFIFANPVDAALQLVSRTVGPDRVIDEFVYNLTHDKTVDWLLPGVPPTRRKLAIPMIAVVNIRGDRLYSEHIWWDQGTALLQAGVIPTHVPYPLPSTLSTSSLQAPMLRLPIAGAETAQMLVDGSKGKSNEMFCAGWGVI